MNQRAFAEQLSQPQQDAYTGDMLISFHDTPEGTITICQELDEIFLDMNIEA